MCAYYINKLRYFKRRFYIRKQGLKIVDKTFLAVTDASISKDFRAGVYSYVGLHSSICPNITIGNFTMLAHDVMILGGDHNYKDAGTPTVFTGRSITKPTIIGKDVWVGAGSIIIDGVNGFLCEAGYVEELTSIINKIRNMSSDELAVISANARDTAMRFGDGLVA